MLSIHVVTFSGETPACQFLGHRPTTTNSLQRLLDVRVLPVTGNKLVKSSCQLVSLNSIHSHLWDVY